MGGGHIDEIGGGQVGVEGQVGEIGEGQVGESKHILQILRGLETKTDEAGRCNFKRNNGFRIL